MAGGLANTTGLRLESAILDGAHHLTVFPPGFTRGLLSLEPKGSRFA
jgi:hypothetical protein